MHSILRRFAAIVFFCWAGWVAWQFRQVDGGGLTAPGREIWLIFGGVLVVAAISGRLAAFLCQSPRRPIASLTATIGLTVLCFFVWHHTGRFFASQPDFVRMVAILIAGAGIGAGFEFGLYRVSFRRDLATGLILFPFALLSLIADRGIIFMTLVATLAATAGVGRTLQEKLAPGISGTEQTLGLMVSVRLALGMVTLGMLAFILGLVHLAYPLILFSVLVVAIFATRTTLLREAQPLRQWLATSAPCSGAGGLIVGLVWALLLIAWIAALAPEVGPDAVGGRQAIVNLWAADHALASYRELALSYMAAGAETFYLSIYPLAGDQSAKLGQFVAVLAMLPMASAFTKHRTAAARLLLLAFGASSIVLVQFAWGFVDLVQSLYYVAALGTGWLWWRQQNRGLLFIASLLAASATAVKLNGLGAVLILGMVVFVARLRSPRLWQDLVKDTLIVCAGTGLILGPWALRSYILSGNPVFPYANGFFASPLAPTELIAMRLGDPLSLATMIQLPWRIFFEPGHYAELGTYHPFLLVAIPLIVAAVLAAASRYWILIGLAAAGLWCITEQNVRYSLFAGWLLVGGTAIWLDQWLSVRPPLERRLAAVAGGILFFVGTYAQLARPASWLFRGTDTSALPLNVVMGHVSHDDYLTSTLPYVTLLKLVDETRGNTAVVWEVPWLRDHLHLAGHAIALPHCDYRLASKLRALLDLPPTPQNLRVIYQALVDLGITHLILPPDSPWAPTTPERPYSAIFSPAFQECAARLEGANNGFLLLTLRPQFSDPQPPLLGLNLVANPDFQPSAPGQPLAHWYQGSILDKPYETTLTLPAGFTIGQQVDIEPGQLYRLELKMPPAAMDQGALVHTAWRDSAGNLLRYITYRVEAKVAAGFATIYQTAPDRAEVVNIDLRGPLTLTGISLQAVRPNP